MTLIIEAASVVVPVLQLDISYPGGVENYLLDASDPRWGARWVLCDEHISAVSFEGAEQAERWARYAAERGSLLGAPDGVAVDVAFCEQGLGPQSEAPWLKWEVDEDGVTWAWHREDDQNGIRVAPVCWVPRDSRKLLRHDARDDADMLSLGSIEGDESWLNLGSGAVRTQHGDGFVRGVSLLPGLADKIASPLSPQRRAECIEDATMLLREADGHIGVALRRVENAIRKAEAEGPMAGSLAGQAKRAFVLALLRILERVKADRKAAGGK